MAVTYAERRNTLRGNDDSKVRTIIDLYKINVDSVADDQSTILSSTFNRVPQIGDAHPNDALVTVKKRSVDRSDNHLQWDMTVTYNNQSDASDQGGGGGSGGGQIIKVAITAWQESFILEKDFNNDLVLNSALDPLKIESSRYHPMITITKVTQNPNLQIVNSVGAVNAGPVNWLGFNFGIDQFLFSAYNTDSIGNNTWNEQFVFKARQVLDLQYGQGGNEVTKGWQAQVLDAGYREIGKNGTPVPIYVQTADGKKNTSKVTQPWPLNAGQAVFPEELKDRRDFLEFKSHRQMHFGNFNFDFSPLFAPLPGQA